MRLLRFIEFLRARLKAVIWIGYGVLALIVVVDALPFLVDKEHAHTKLEHLPGFWSVFGFVACTLIIFVSKWYGHAGIMKREDYYDE
jgi:hypothetical protein